MCGLVNTLLTPWRLEMSHCDPLLHGFVPAQWMKAWPAAEVLEKGNS